MENYDQFGEDYARAKITPNEVAIDLREWLDRTPQKQHPSLWREIDCLLEGGFDVPDVHEKRLKAWLAIQALKELH